MTYRIELRVDATNRVWALQWMKERVKKLEESGGDHMEGGGGGGIGTSVSFNVYAGPVPLTDKERIEALEATVARLVRGGP